MLGERWQNIIEHKPVEAAVALMWLLHLPKLANMLHTLLSLQQECLRSMTKSSGCWNGLQIPQISFWSSIPGMCWKNKSDPLTLPLYTLHDWICCSCVGASHYRTSLKDSMGKRFFSRRKGSYLHNMKNTVGRSWYSHNELWLCHQCPNMIGLFFDIVLVDNMTLIHFLYTDIVAG